MMEVESSTLLQIRHAWALAWGERHPSSFCTAWRWCKGERPAEGGLGSPFHELSIRSLQRSSRPAPGRSRSSVATARTAPPPSLTLPSTYGRQPRVRPHRHHGGRPGQGQGGQAGSLSSVTAGVCSMPAHGVAPLTGGQLALRTGVVCLHRAGELIAACAVRLPSGPCPSPCRRRHLADSGC